MAYEWAPRGFHRVVWLQRAPDTIRTCGLDLTLLIDAKHHSLVRRIEIKPDPGAQLLDEKGIGRKLEAAGAVRLQTEELKQAMDGAES
jgi:hypothetical protein